MRISKKSKIILAAIIGLIVVVVVLITVLLVLSGLQFFTRESEIPRNAFFRGSLEMKQDEIKDLYEKAPKTDDQSQLIYEDVITGYPATVVYSFAFGFLINVECLFSIEGLSISECQEMGENLTALLTPYFEPEQYDYYGFVKKAPGNKYAWIFGAFFKSKNSRVLLVGNNHPENNELAAVFMPENFLVNLVAPEHSEFVEQSNDRRETYGEFDYDKWRDVPATFKEQEASGN